MSKTKMKIAVESVKAAVKELAGPIIEELVREDYLAKSRGEADSCGRKWKPTKRSIEKGEPIMILTGALLDSLTLTQTADGWKLEFDGVKYGKFALAKRPAWPNVNDPVWRGVLAKRLTSRLKEKLKVTRG